MQSKQSDGGGQTVEGATYATYAQPTLLRKIATTTVAGVGSALLAAAIAVVVSLIARLVLALPTPAEIYGDQLTQIIPVALFSRMLSLFGANTKHVYYAALLLGEVTLTALVGAMYWAVRQYVYDRKHGGAANDSTRLFVDGALLVALLWLLPAALLAPIIGGGAFGSGFSAGIAGTFVSQLLPDTIFALCFVGLLRRQITEARVKPQTSSANSERTTRRQLLRQGGAAAVVLIGGALIWEGISAGLGSLFGIGGPAPTTLKDIATGPSRIVPPPTPTYGPWTPVSGLTAEITPTANFYYVSKDLVGDPQVALNSWQLQITGLVEQPYSLSYADLLALPAIEQYHTLECISNDVGGNLMSSSLFTGVSLSAVLQHAGLKENAGEVIFSGADGYSDSLHLKQALDERSLIAYRINGDALPAAHGFPARLLIPGLYGMKNGKWLTQLEVGAGGYTGYWEQRGWTREALVKETARIDTPHDGDLLVSGRTYIAGVAYAGASGVGRVEVSTDGGQTWLPANLKRPLSSLTWVLWEYPWMARSGQYTIAARVIDQEGYVQTAALAAPIPGGASGYDAVQVVVR